MVEEWKFGHFKWGFFDDIGLDTDFERDTINAERTKVLAQYVNDIVTDDELGCRIVDIGCNCGYFLRGLSKRGAKNLVGVDARAQHLEFIRKWADKDGVSVRLINSNVEDLPKELFDNSIVFIFAILQHLAKPFQLLDTIAASDVRYALIESVVWQEERFDIETCVGSRVYGLGDSPKWYPTRIALEREITKRGFVCEFIDDYRGKMPSYSVTRELLIMGR